MLRRLVPPAAALILSTACAAAQEPALPDAERLEALLAEYGVPGLSIATLRDCDIDRTANVGLARRAPDAPVTDTTVFEAASLSKPVFAYLVMQLVDEGIVDLDAPLSDTAASERIIDTDAYDALTPRMVLTHRTGLPNWAPDRNGPLEFTAPPDTTYSYSGEAFELLRAHVEAATGQGLDQLFRDRLGPVMPNSAFAAPLADGTTPSRGYDADGNDRALSFRGGSAGGLVTTASDYAAFLSLVCRGEGLTPETLAEMLRPQADAPQGDFPGPVSRSLGWAILTLGGDTVVLHDGNNFEYRAFAAVLPAYREEGKSHLSIAFGCTGGQHRSVALAEETAKALAAAGWQVSKRHRELERRAETAPGATGPAEGGPSA